MSLSYMCYTYTPILNSRIPLNSIPLHRLGLRFHVAQTAKHPDDLVGVFALYQSSLSSSVST